MSYNLGNDPVMFDGQVAVITGAGGGLGKTYALAFASRGAKVVVNDLGGSFKGEGQDKAAADLVVEEIKNSGGIAVANYDSVEDGHKIIQTALDHFGKIDILVNNAGILRDKSFPRMKDGDWDAVHNVHLRGAFLVTRAAYPHMKNQAYGRIIMTSSGSGIYGNFGQANYSSAKLGIVGLCNTIAIEGQKYNIHCNTIAPMGGTRLTQGILPPDLYEELKPELISPLVLWLSHGDCEETGSLIEAAGGWFGKYRWQRSKGKMCRISIQEPVTPEAVREHWSEITDFENPDHVTSFEEDAALIANSLEELKENKNNTKMVPLPPLSKPVAESGPLSIVGYSEKDIEFEYSVKEVILYALSVGATTGKPEDMKFVFEGHPDFCCLPTFAVVPSQVPLFQGFLVNFPTWDIDLTKVLHGEQYVEVFWPLPTFGVLKSDIKITDVLDKGSGALVVAEVNTWDDEIHLVAKSQFCLFVVGEGGFGGPRNSSSICSLKPPPDRKPDAVSSFTTQVDQAALYRLNGDFNPLHIDPDFASVAGHQKPILHGLCSYGVAAKAILEKFCDNDVSRFKAIKARFAKPVIPGQTLLTSMWKEKSRIHFEVRVEENDQVCLSGGYVEISESQQIPALVPGTVKSGPLLKTLAETVSSISQHITHNRGLIVFVITVNHRPRSCWTLDLSRKPDILYEGSQTVTTQPDSIMSLEDIAMLKVFNKEETFTSLYLKGHLNVRGSYPPLKLLQKLFTLQSSL